MVTAAEIDALWDFGDPAASEERFRALLPAARTGDPSVLAELMTQIARTYSLRRQFEQANVVLDKVERTLPQLGDVRPKLRYLLERGRTLNSSGQRDAARPLFVEAWELGLAAGEERLAIDAAHMVAITETGQAQLEWNLKALERARETTQEDAKKWVGSLTNNLGWSYHDLGDHARALLLFEENADWYRERGLVDQLAIARWAVARQLRALGRLDEALALQRALAGEAIADGDEPGGFNEEELGECLLAMGREDEARAHFASAYEQLSDPESWVPSSQPERLARIKRLAGL